MQIAPAELEIMNVLWDQPGIGAAEIAEGVTLDTSPLIGKSLGYDDLPKGITAAAVLRDGEVIFASSDVTVRANDHALLFYEGSMTSKVEQFFRVSADFF